MALKDTITKWHTAMKFLEDGAYEECIEKLFEVHQPSAKILHNMGCIYAVVGELLQAIQQFSSALELDKYLALSYYQRAVCYYYIKKYDRAELDFLTAKSMIHSECIDYCQLGAKVILTHQMIDDCVTATRAAHSKHSQIGLPAVPYVDCVFYPPRKMVASLGKQDFLGKAKVISSVEVKDIIYAAEKKDFLNVPKPPKKPSSLPSSPCLPLRQGDQRPLDKGTSVFVHPPPHRPPPRLPGSTSIRPNAFPVMRRKSHSVEHIASSDSGLYEDVEVSLALPPSTSSPRLHLHPKNVCSENLSSNRTHRSKPMKPPPRPPPPKFPR